MSDVLYAQNPFRKRAVVFLIVFTFANVVGVAPTSSLHATLITRFLVYNSKTYINMFVYELSPIKLKKTILVTNRKYDYNN